MPHKLWTSPDIHARFRRRSALMRLGIAWLALSVPAGLAIAWFHGGKFGFLVWIIQFMLWYSLMSTLYRCLNCGAALGTYRSRASSRTGFNCNTCGCVHRESDGLGIARRASNTDLVLPHAVARCWLYPPLLEQYAKLRRRDQAAWALGALAGLFFLAWLLMLGTDWNPLRLPPLAYPVVFGLSFVVALFLYFSAARCPHCAMSLSNQIGLEYTNTLVHWCGECGAVLHLTPAARKVYRKQGKVVDMPPVPGAPKSAEEVIAEADRLLKSGRTHEACAVIDRAMETHSDSRLLLDWLRRNATALREL